MGINPIRGELKLFTGGEGDFPDSFDVGLKVADQLFGDLGSGLVEGVGVGNGDGKEEFSPVLPDVVVHVVSFAAGENDT